MAEEADSPDQRKPGKKGLSEIIPSAARYTVIANLTGVVLCWSHMLFQTGCVRTIIDLAVFWLFAALTFPIGWLGAFLLRDDSNSLPNRYVVAATLLANACLWGFVAWVIQANRKKTSTQEPQEER